MKTLWKSIKLTLSFCVVLAVGYVFVLWIVAQAVTPNRGQAEVVLSGDRVVGAACVGQSFTKKSYFWGRPSAVEYNGGGSGGSNKGPNNPEYLSGVSARTEAFLHAHNYLKIGDVPAEIVTASASGLDPDISPAAALVQVKRVARARGLSEQSVRELVERSVQKPFLDLFGTPKVNVLKLNVALDGLSLKKGMTFMRSGATGLFGTEIHAVTESGEDVL